MQTNEIGKVFKAEWLALGCPRTAFFKLEGFAKNGNAKGLYLDAGATKWVKTSIKREHFSRYQVLAPADLIGVDETDAIIDMPASRLMRTEDTVCRGHESTSGPAGISVYCNGACR